MPGWPGHGECATYMFRELSGDQETIRSQEVSPVSGVIRRWGRGTAGAGAPVSTLERDPDLRRCCGGGLSHG